MLKKISNKRNILALAAILLIVSMMAISCSAQGVAEPEDTIDIFFGDLVAKAEGKNDGYDHTAYDSTGSNSAWASEVINLAKGEVFWAYRAVKADNLYKEGETGAGTEGMATGFKAVKEDAGLDAVLKDFSRGSWTFELRGYQSSDDRAADKNVIYKGKATTVSLEENSTIDVPVTYAYADMGANTDADGKMGYVAFDITVNYKQKNGASYGEEAIGEYGLIVEAVIGKNAAGNDIAEAITLNKVTDETSDLKPVTNTEEGWLSKTYHYIAGNRDISRLQEIAQDGELHVYITGANSDKKEEILGAAYTVQKAVIMSGLETKITATLNVTLDEGGKINITLDTTTPDEQPKDGVVDTTLNTNYWAETGYIENVNTATNVNPVKAD